MSLSTTRLDLVLLRDVLNSKDSHRLKINEYDLKLFILNFMDGKTAIIDTIPFRKQNIYYT